MNKLERLAKAPMTASTAEFLIQEYDQIGISVDDFAQTLPSQATIIDIAAGRSNFGVEIARRRDDITWINLDVKYDNHEDRTTLQNVAPQNVLYLPGDALSLPSDLKQQFDRVYSYYFIPHLLRVRRDIGKHALTGMQALLKPSGELFVGPTNGPRYEVSTPQKHHAVSLDADSSNEAIESVLDSLTPPRLRSLVLDAMDVSGVSTFSTQRLNGSEQSHLPLLFDHRTETYHKIMSKRGIALASRLALGFLKRDTFDELV